MASFNQYGTASVVQQFTRSSFHHFDVANLLSRQHFRFTQIGSYNTGKRHKKCGDSFNCIILHKFASACWYHNRIEHDKLRLEFFQRFGYNLHNLYIVYHANLDRTWTDIRHNSFYLSLYVAGRYRMNTCYSTSILYCDCCNGTGSISSQCWYSLYVGLNAGSSTAIRSGNSEHARIMFHNFIIRIVLCKDKKLILKYFLLQCNLLESLFVLPTIIH